MQTYTYDAIVLGAGLGGLLSAAQLMQSGKRVLIVERLPHSGGRFTAKSFHGVQVSTGAVHMVPFGSSGALSRTLQRLQIPHHLFDVDVFGSFHVRGKQVRARGLLGMLRVLGPRQFFWFMRVGWLMFFQSLLEAERKLPFETWLARHIDLRRNYDLLMFFRAISRFALSVELHQVSTDEVVTATRNMFRYGAPGIVEGGCGALTANLERQIIERGADLRLRCEVVQIIQEYGRVTGVRLLDKASGEECIVQAPLIVSDIGPRATNALLRNQRLTQKQVLKQQSISLEQGKEPSEAIGLKVHILSNVSLIPHKGIMYCLDTRRIAGVVQPTNSDPRLAPAGKHLLISHQVIQSEDLEEEKELALADLRKLFGARFETECQVVTMGMYRGEWPVNRLVQGEDLSPETGIQGLYLVGDAVKPSGYLMVEGVAQSVNRLMDLLEVMEQGKVEDPKGSHQLHRSSYVIQPPSRLTALRWLWEAPGNSGHR